MKSNLDDKTTALGKRARDCYEKFVKGALWDEVVASEPLMLYSKEFRDFVAEKCGVNPESGNPLEGPTDEELADEIDNAIDGDAEKDADEEPGADSSGTNDEEEVDDSDVDEVDETEEEEEAESIIASHNDCHWCGSTEATVCLMVQAQEGGETRLVRMDHLCADCAAAYWTAIHNVQKERMF